MQDTSSSVVMCDWVTAVIEAPTAYTRRYSPWDSGYVGFFEPGGKLVRSSGRRQAVEGSYSSQITFRSSTGYELEISGNPVKYLQGHNLFGCDDWRSLFFSAAADMRDRVGLQFPSPGSYRDFKPVRATRLDYTRSYRHPGGDAAAAAWLASVGPYSRSRYGTSSYKGDTLYFGAGSSYWTFKIYLKSAELLSPKRGHGLPSSLSRVQRRELLEWADGVLRFEVRLNSRALAKLPLGLSPLQIWQKYYDKVQIMGGSVSPGVDDRLAGVTSGAVMAFRLWQSGDGDTIRGFPRMTAYRYRKAIREAVGVDIFGPPPAPEPFDPELPASGWDPEPISALQFMPDPELVRRYLAGE